MFHVRKIMQNIIMHNLHHCHLLPTSERENNTHKSRAAGLRLDLYEAIAGKDLTFTITVGGFLHYQMVTV